MPHRFLVYRRTDSKPDDTIEEMVFRRDPKIPSGKISASLRFPKSDKLLA